jgi:hypothetical protein
MGLLQVYTSVKIDFEPFFISLSYDFNTLVNVVVICNVVGLLDLTPH